MQITDKEKKGNQIMDEKFDIEYDIFERLNALIMAKWDSNTLKLEIEKLNKQRQDMWNEMDKLEDLFNQSDKNNDKTEKRQ